MTGTLGTNRRLSAWEIRERIKNNRSEHLPRVSIQRSLSMSDAVGEADTKDHPPASRDISAGQKLRRNSGLPPSIPRKEKLSKLPSQRDLQMPSKEGSVERKSTLNDSFSKFELPSQRDLHMPSKGGSVERKSTLNDSFSKFELEFSFRDRESPKRGNSAVLKRDPYSARPSKLLVDNSDDSDGTSSLDSQPPPEREQRSPSYRGISSLNMSTSSFNAALDLSEHRSLDLSLHRTMNLSRHRNLPVHEQIVTSATDDRWARFKLLGRLGLGNIRLSCQAQALVKQNFVIMLRAIKHVYALRDGENEHDSVESFDAEKVLDIQTGHLLKEVQETIHVSEKGPAKLKRDPNKIEVEGKVQEQLKDFITVISSMYRDNPFHDLEHASTVLKSVDKLINLVQPPVCDADYRDLRYGYGIATEPWNHFALVFAALIHDVDHSGVPNSQLIKEKSHIAGAYKNRSVAEQNSIELAWNLLMEPCYRELRESIFLLRSELTNFRSLLITAVLATDIADKELAALRTGRAAEALKVEEGDVDHAGHADMDLVSRKATFVVETLIQVADVSHTMSNFDVYKKWNHRLYKEMYEAYQNGRAENDPTETWYKGEFDFFDFYLIPLARKLLYCGIFGEDSAAYLGNAMENRKIWEEKGKTLVASFVAEREAEEKSKMRTIFLHDMALGSSSSDRSDLGDSFAGESAFSGALDDYDDNDSVSISSNEVDSDSERHVSSGIRPNTSNSLMRMREHVVAMKTEGKDRVPSKASTETRKPTRIVYRSKSSEMIEEAKKASVRMGGVRRSKSGEAALQTALDNTRDVELGLMQAGIKPHARSRSPCLGSEQSQSKLVVKIRSGSRSPSALRSDNSGTQRGGAMQGRRPSRSESPSAGSDSSPEQQKPKNGKVVRRGRRPSRSRSPTAGSDQITAAPGTVEKTMRRGRRPSRSKSPTAGSDHGTQEPGTEKELRRGKRPAKIRSKASLMD